MLKGWKRPKREGDKYLRLEGRQTGWEEDRRGSNARGEVPAQLGRGSKNCESVVTQEVK